MKIHLVSFVFGLVAGSVSLMAADLDPALKQFAGYEFGASKKPLHDARLAAFRGANDPRVLRRNEQLLLTFVQSDATLAARREACLWLGDLATDASVPVLEKLAADRDFADVAGIALASLQGGSLQISGELESPSGKLRRDVLNSTKPEEVLGNALLGEDDDLARVAFHLIAQGMAAKDATGWLGENMGSLKPSRQVVAMNVLLQLDAAEKQAVITRLAVEGEAEARLAAIRNLGSLGLKKDVPGLLKLLAGESEALSKAARAGLLGMPDDAIRGDLLNALQGATPETQAKAIDVAEARGSVWAANDLIRIAGEEDNPNQIAAVTALGKTAAPDRFAHLLELFAATEGTAIQKKSQSAIWILARRQPDYAKAIQLMKAQGAKSPDSIRAALDSMAKRLGTLISKPAGKPTSQNGVTPLLPGKFEQVVPKRFAVASHLNCGPERETAGEGESIQCLNGKAWNEMPGTDASLSLLFAPNSLEFSISGLQAEDDYILGMTWWDTDFAGRRQAVSLNGSLVLPDTRPIAYDENSGRGFLGKPTPVRIQFALLPGHIKDGKVNLSIRKLAGPNAVTSEVWIMKRKQEAAGKQVLLVSGQDYPGHHWRKTGPELAKIIEEDPRMEVTICESPYALGLTHLSAYDTVVIHFKNYQESLPSTAAMRDSIDRFVRNGGGMCLSHFACGAMQEWPEFVKLSGRVWNGKGHDKRGPFNIRVVDAAHPIMRGLEDFETDDELYYCLKGNPDVHLLCDAHSKVKNAWHPQAFTLHPDKGRVFLSTLGHDVRAYQPVPVRKLYRQAAAWACGLN